MINIFEENNCHGFSIRNTLLSNLSRKEKTLRNIFTFLSMIALIEVPAFAQITINESQFRPILRVGDSLTVLTITDTSMNIGSTGGPNTYDLSKLNYFSSKIAVEAGSAVPTAAAHFPNDTLLGGGGFYNVLSFSGGNLGGLGSVEGDNSSLNVVHRVPGEEIFSFPLTMGKTWNYNMTVLDTAFSNGVAGLASSYTSHRTTIVDGYGTLILPGGDTLQCLRLTQGPASPSEQSYDTFFFVTQTGTFVNIDASRIEGNTGVVGISSAQVIEGSVATAVRNMHPLPSMFALYQNYPNPFNPTTVIGYQLTAVSHVTLKVYDVLGREVATLVDGQQNAGVYNVNFNGSRFASGVYFYRINAVGDDGQKFVSVKKLVLMK
jgi:hypothetical protein